MDYKKAEEIMGPNYFGPDELAIFLGIETKGEFSNVPYSEELLRECKETHFLFLLCPLSVNILKEKAKKGEFPIEIKDIINTRISFNEDELYPNAFNEREKGWYLIAKNPIAIKIRWNELERFLSSKREEIPTACKIFYANLYSLILTDTPIFTDIFLRCSDRRTIQCNISYRGIIKFINKGFVMHSRDETYTNSVAYVAGKKP